MENLLFYGDNLEIIQKHRHKYFKDESIDLIYLDPPFSSDKSYNITYKDSEAQAKAFEDTWSWKNIKVVEAYDKIINDYIDDENVASVIDLMKGLVENIYLKTPETAYLVYMCIRLLEFKRLLKDTGSIYLHCDPTMSHYLKLLMDAIFGKENFRNEIIWHYKGSGSSDKYFAQKHDTIFWYSKTSDYVFNEENVRELKEKKHIESHKGYPLMDKDGKYYCIQKRDGIEYKYYMRETIKSDDVWDIPVVNSMAKERLDYPTQKPAKLLRKIILASSNKGDIILDPFCGSGTTLAAAEELNKQWIGIDITHLATALVKHRLNKAKFDVIGEPKDLAGAKALATDNENDPIHLQFEYWFLSLIGAVPAKKKKGGGDGGKDGLYFFTDNNKTRKAICSVKSGRNLTLDMMSRLIQVVDSDKVEMGFFLTLHRPSKGIYKLASGEGFYKDSFGNSYQKIQILTTEEILNGKRPHTPTMASPHKPVEKIKKENSFNQSKLL